MNQHATGTDIERLRARARALFLSRATIDSMLEWATPRQILAIDRMLASELENRETAKRARLMRRARLAVIKSLEGYDFANVKLPEGCDQVQLLDLDFTGKAQDLVFYGKTGRGKTHLAIALGMKAVERDLNARFHQTAELVLQLGKAKRDGTLENMLKDLAKADLIIPGRVRLRALAPRRGASPLPDHRRFVRKKEHHLHHQHRIRPMGHDLRRRQTRRRLSIDRIVHHGRLIEFTGPSRRISEALMFNNHNQ